MKKLLELIKHSQNSRGKKIFLQAYLVMTLIRLGLWLLPFNRLQNLVAKSKQLAFLALAPDQVNVNRIALAVYRCSRYQPASPMCLARALTTAVLMNIYSLPHEVKIGVAKGEKGIDAHAWVISQGVVVVGDIPDLSRYAIMSSRGEGLTI